MESWARLANGKAEIAKISKDLAEEVFNLSGDFEDVAALVDMGHALHDPAVFSMGLVALNQKFSKGVDHFIGSPNLKELEDRLKTMGLLQKRRQERTTRAGPAAEEPGYNQKSGQVEMVTALTEALKKAGEVSMHTVEDERVAAEAKRMALSMFDMNPSERSATFSAVSAPASRFGRAKIKALESAMGSKYNAERTAVKKLGMLAVSQQELKSVLRGLVQLGKGEEPTLHQLYVIALVVSDIGDSMDYASLGGVSLIMTTISCKLAKLDPKSVEEHKNDIEDLLGKIVARALEKVEAAAASGWEEMPENASRSCSTKRPRPTSSNCKWTSRQRLAAQSGSSQAETASERRQAEAEASATTAEPTLGGSAATPPARGSTSK